MDRNDEFDQFLTPAQNTTEYAAVCWGAAFLITIFIIFSIFSTIKIPHTNGTCEHFNNIMHGEQHALA